MRSDLGTVRLLFSVFFSVPSVVSVVQLLRVRLRALRAFAVV
jgi:hypothetical protein